VKAHQDDSVDFNLLHQLVQLNCMVDASTKQEILNEDVMALLRQQHFSKEPICCFVGKEKMTSDTGPLLQFWAYKQIARDVFAHCKIFNPEQFDLVARRYVSAALEEVPTKFQLWACKQVMGIAATNGLRAKWTEGLSDKCPSCWLMKETCGHILHCNVVGHVEALMQTFRLLEKWLLELETGKLFSEICLLSRNEILRRDLLARPTTPLDGCGTGQNRMAPVYGEDDLHSGG
jgi:hypothetical protein